MCPSPCLPHNVVHGSRRCHVSCLSPQAAAHAALLLRLFSTAGQVITVFFGSFIAGSFANQVGRSRWCVACVGDQVGVGFESGGCDNLSWCI